MRNRTASDVKWLINEVAALAGELARLDREMARLATLRDAAQRAHEACTRTLAYVAKRQSLPELPVVRVPRAYGGRGKLRALLKEVLKGDAPHSLTTAELAAKAIDHFGLQFSCPEELYDFRVNSIGRALRKMQAAGLVERVVTGERVRGALGTWRWKQSLPTLDAVKKSQNSGVEQER